MAFTKRAQYVGLSTPTCGAACGAGVLPRPPSSLRRQPDIGLPSFVVVAMVGTQASRRHLAGSEILSHTPTHSHLRTLWHTHAHARTHVHIWAHATPNERT